MKNSAKKLLSMFLTLVMCFSVFTVSSFTTKVEAAGETFIIDPGHGGYDPGAVLGNRYESHDVLRLALRVGEIVSQYASVTYTRTTDVYVSLQGRCNIANGNGNKYFVSLHRNSASSSTATGSEVYYSSGTKSANMAAAINSEIAAAVPWRNRGVKTANYIVIANTTMPAVLAEVGFICNPSDNALFDQYFEAMATGIARGMLAQVGITLGSTTPTTPSITQNHILDGNNYVDMGKDFYARVSLAYSGKYLTDVNNEVYATDYTGENTQVWHFMRQASGAYLVGNVSTSLFWDVAGAVYDNGTKLMTHTANYGANQKFYIYYIGGGFYFMPEGGDKTIDVDADSLRTQVYGCSTGEENSVERNARQFNLEILNIYTGSRNISNLGDSFTATIKNVSSGKFLTASGSSLIGANASGANNQKWKFTRLANGAYTIESVSEGLFIDVAGAKITEGTDVELYEGNGTKAQTFFIISKDGTYYIKTSYTLNTLDMDASTFDICTYTTGEDATKIATQKFEIAIVDEVTDETELILNDSSSYKKDGIDLYKVASETTVATFLSSFQNKKAVVLDRNGNAIETNALITTGCTINLVVNGETIDALTVIIMGDVNSDGSVNATDYLRIKNQVLGLMELEDTCIKAADADGSSVIDSTDLLRVKGHFLGTYNLNN